MRPPTLPCLLAAFLLACPAAAASALSGPELLQQAAQDAYGSLPAEVQGGEAERALASQAYLSTISLSGEAQARAWEAEAWDAAQASADPATAFLQAVVDRWHLVRSELEAAASGLGNATAPVVSAATADALVVVAHLLVEGEIEHERAGRLLTGQLKRDHMRESWQRYEFFHLLGTAQAHAKAARDLLANLPVGGPRLEWSLLQEGMEIAPAGTIWILPERGIFHRLARHVEMASNRLRNTTLSELDIQVEAVATRLDSDPPYNRAWVASVVQDARWWRDRAATEYQPSWDPLIDNLANLAAGSAYEASLLKEGLAELPSGLPLWMVGALLGAVAVAAAAWWALAGRKRRRGRGQLLGGALLILLAAGWLPAAAAEPLPADPATTGVAFTSPEVGAWGQVALDAAGNADFTWVACPVQGTGCWDIWTRHFDVQSKSWSASSKLFDGPNNISLPQLHHMASGDHLFWVESVGEDTPSETIVFHWCRLSASRHCSSDEVLSGGPASGVKVKEDPSSGYPVATWTEAFAESSRVVLRRLGPVGWSAPVAPSTAPTQRSSDLAVDAAGTATLVWQENAGGGPDSILRRLMYATVSPLGVASIPSILRASVEPKTEPSVGILSNGTVGVLYNDFSNTYLVERHPGQATWTVPLNVSRVPGRNSQSEVRLLADGQDWLAFWRTGTVREMKIWEADRRDGIWLAPHVILGNPFSSVIVEPSVQSANGLVHLAWTGTGPGAEDFQMHYRLIGAAASLDPPAVSSLSPADGGWTMGLGLEAVVTFSAQAPLDMARCLLELDGHNWPLQLVIRQGGQVLATQVGPLPDGAHSGRVVLVDRDGRQSSRDWSFKTDSVKPSLQATLLAGEEPVALVSRWWNKPLALQASSPQDSGAPIRIQVSADDGANYFPFPPPPATEDHVDLPENKLVRLRLRALDEAGNVNVLPRIDIGWDATPPNLTATVPTWSRSPLRIAVQGLDREAGSPVELRIVARDASGAQQDLQAPAQDGNAAVELADGRFTLDLEAVDEAGNRAAVASGVDVTIDSVPPTFEFDPATGALRVRDGGGLGLVSLADGEATLREQAYDGEGEAILPLSGLGSRLLVVALDRAGNEMSAWVSPQTGAIEPILPAPADVQPASGPPSSGTARETPALPPVALAAVLAALAAAGRRCRRGS